jgi:hypothetical protein
MESGVFVPKGIEVLGKSSFERSDFLSSLVFENGSKLKTIGNSAFAGCKSFVGISIPRSVEIIGDAAFKGCSGLESLEVTENARLAKIGKESFGECSCLRNFRFPKGVEGIGKNCFNKCISLQMLKFESAESLRNVVGDMTLDEALKYVGFAHISSVFKIEVDHGPVELEFPEWISVLDENLKFTLIRDTR